MRKMLLVCLCTFAGGMMLTPFQARSVTIAKDSATYYHELGNREMEARKYSAAWRYYEKATLLEPNNVNFQKSLSDVCFKMNKNAPALKALEQVHKLAPDDKDAAFKLTRIYFTYGQHKDVLTMAQKIKQRQWKMDSLNYMVGKSYYQMQDYGRSIEYLKLAIKEDPTNADAVYFTGRMYISMSNYEMALPYYRDYMKLDTTQAGRFYEYALLLATTKDFDNSILWFQRAVGKGYPARDDFYMNLANTYADAKQTDKALVMLKDLLKRRPHDMSIFTSLAELYYHTGNYKDAIAYYDRMLEYEKDNARALYMIGVSYIKMGKENDGKLLCDKAIVMDPSLAVLRHEVRR